MRSYLTVKAEYGYTYTFYSRDVSTHGGYVTTYNAVKAAYNAAE